MQGKDADRIKIDDFTYSVVCYQCERQFEARRADASFCSARCRVAHSREPQKLENAIAFLNGCIYQLSNITSRYKRDKRVYDALLKLRRTIDNLLAEFETQE